jgi:hypothetical protein
MAATTDELLDRLPETFRYSEALGRVSERRLRRLLENGAVVAFPRGLYRKRDWVGDEDLVEIAATAPQATLCLRSALARHELIDDIPAEIDIAIPCGSWTPATTAPVRWRHFDPDTFKVGHGRLDMDGARSIGLYSAERSIIDAFRMRSRRRRPGQRGAQAVAVLRRSPVGTPHPGTVVPAHPDRAARDDGDSAVGPVRRGTPAGEAYLDLRNEAPRRPAYPGAASALCPRRVP